MNHFLLTQLKKSCAWHRLVELRARELPASSMLLERLFYLCRTIIVIIIIVIMLTY